MLALLQLLAMILALQVSSFAHLVADVLDHLDCSVDCEHEHSTDDSDRECPPGCPTCHSCAHAQAPYVPRAAHVETAPIAIAPARLEEDDGPPTQRERSSIFRPPRARPFAV